MVMPISLFFLYWFGASLVRDDAFTFKSMTIDQGLSQNTVWTIAQDHWGFMWFGTTSGLNRWDGQSFETFTKKKKADSISDNSIRAFFEDSRQRIWVGTKNGLTCYIPQTNRYIIFTSEPSAFSTPLTKLGASSLTQNYVMAITEESPDVLWVATRKGLNRLTLPPESPYTFEKESVRIDPLPEFGLIRALVNENGKLWIGTRNGLYQLDLKQFDPDTFRLGQLPFWSENNEDPYSLSHDEVRSIFKDSQNRIWVGTNQGLNLFVPGKNGFIHDFKFNQKDQASFDLSKVRVNVLTGRLNADTVADDEIWIGTTEHGLIRFNINEPHKSRVFGRQQANWGHETNVISSNDIISLCFDHSGLLWIGTYFDGVSKLNLLPQKFQDFSDYLERDDQLDDVRAIHQDQEGLLWFGSEGSVLGFDPEVSRVVQSYRHEHEQPNAPESLSEVAAQTIVAWKDLIWVGFYEGGINAIDKTTKQVVKRFLRQEDQEQGLSSNTVRKLFVDQKGVLWAGTLQGLDYFDVKTQDFMPYKVIDDLQPLSKYERTVQELFESDNGILWAGCADGGLLRIDRTQETFERFRYRYADPSARTLSNDTVNAIMQDNAGHIWVGTDSGLNLYLGENPSAPQEVFQRFDRSHGLPSESIFNILPGEEGGIWVTTGAGIAKIQFNEGARTIKVKAFDHLDGILDYDYSSGAAIITSEGDFLVGCSSGANVFNPKKIQYNKTPPSLVLTSFKVLNQHANLNSEPYLFYRWRDNPQKFYSLEPNEKNFSVEFAALDYRAPSKNKYQYSLEKRTKNWAQNISSNPWRSVKNPYLSFRNLAGARSLHQQ